MTTPPDQTAFFPQIGTTGCSLRQFYAGLIFAALIRDDPWVMDPPDRRWEKIRRIAIEQADLLHAETNK